MGPLLRRPLGRAVATTELLAGVKRQNAAIRGRCTARRRPTAQAQPETMPAVGVLHALEAILTLANLPSEIQRGVASARPA